ncbi:GIY-YIG nuclease family protein [Sporomusa termitida]|uniref:Group I intron endonuclease n=1 Tax=Sporomusa termitida TaxID=2377 RepID=A0A517DY66_9FIRM|nr:GIY-YIG nuclease family protein [Sporomusa termitida]QDR82304.1 group I intron endonuclease [Sporomusa termitida]
MGVYQIKNTVTGKLFIGSSLDLPGKLNSNRFQLSMKSHHNKELQADWNLYGSDAFTFEVLENINPEKIAQESWRNAVAELEEKWLDTLQPYGDKGYNPPAKPLAAANNTL